MSQVRRIQREMRRRAGDGPNARTDAQRRVRPLVSACVTDADLARALYRPPLDVQRSAAKTREWKRTIAMTLAVPERKRAEIRASLETDRGLVAAMRSGKWRTAFAHHAAERAS